MLGKQRNNQANDPQFMDAAWKNMAEILDQEMPVEKKAQRIGWLSIAAILVVGFVGGVTVMWGLQKHQPAPMAINYQMDTHQRTEIIHPDMEIKNDIISTEPQKEENPILISNNKVAYNSKPTRKQNIVTSNPEKKAHSVNTINTQQNWVAANVNVQSTNHGNQNELSPESVMQNTSDVRAIIESAPEKTIAATRTISMNPVEKIENLLTPLPDLPNLDMAMLPIKGTNLMIEYDLDLPKNKKWKTGIYAGAIIAGKTGNGLEVAFRTERKLGAKWGVETGLGFRATQVGFLSENENTENLAFSDAANLTDPDSIYSSNENRQQIANKINADAADYHLTVPLSLVYRPTGKLRLALGMSWAYRLNKLKEASSLAVPVASFEADGFLDQNSFSERFNDFRLNLGVGYQFNARTGIELAYSERLTDRNAGLYTFSDDQGSPIRFFQLGWIHYFGG